MRRKPSYRELEQRVLELEDQLKQARLEAEKYLLAFYANPIVMAVSHLESGRFIAVNDAFCKEFNITRENVIGCTSLELGLWDDPGDREDLLIQSKNLEHPTSRVLKMRSRDGKKLVAQVYFRPMYLEAEKYMLSVVMDVDTQRKIREDLEETRQRYRSLVEKSPLPMIVHSEGAIDFINPAAVDLLRGNSSNDFLGKPILDFIHPDYHEIGIQRIQNIYEKRSDAALLEEKFVRLDGTVVDVEVAANIVDYQGRPASQAIVIDITDRKLIEAEQQKLQKLETVGLLAGGIAHDFNNILSAILGNLSLSLLDIEPGNNTYTLLKAAEKASMRARGLTQQLLTFSRGGEPVKENASVRELIRDSADFILSGAITTCRYHFSQDVWPVEVDKGQISQVIQNLIINANQAMPDGGFIDVTVRNTSLEAGDVALLHPGKYITIKIRDYGVGIEKKILGKIFDPYFSTRREGSGLGLSIAYSITRKHNGAIVVQSTPGEGSEFTVYLPAYIDESDLGSNGDNGPLSGGAGSILLMDDDPDVRNTAGAMLEMLGFSVIPTSEGGEALAVYKEKKEQGNPFDIVIVDLTVPGGMGGRETAGRILEIDPHAKIIVVSGYSNDPVMANYRDYGFVGMLPKPIILKHLDRLLSSLLEN